MSEMFEVVGEGTYDANSDTVRIVRTDTGATLDELTGYAPYHGVAVDYRRYNRYAHLDERLPISWHADLTKH